MTDTPLVSVVLPCYNASRAVADALRSLQAQTYPKLEILALNDGSQDSTLEILEGLARQDPRIRVISSEQNRGLIATLNRGIEEARGQLVARMDADDISAPTRIARSVMFLSDRPDISVVGAGARFISAVTGRPLRARPTRCFEPAGARFMALFATPIAHVTMVARTEVMRSAPYGVGPHSLHTEDYEMFARMIADGVRFANLRERLMTVRSDPRGVSLGNEQLQIINFVRSARAHLERVMGLSPDPSVHRVLVNRMDATLTPAALSGGLKLLDDLETRALAAGTSALERGDIRRVAGMQRADILLQAARLGGRQIRAQVAWLLAAKPGPLIAPGVRGYILSKLR